MRQLIYILSIGLFFSCSNGSEKENLNHKSLSESHRIDSTSQDGEIAKKRGLQKNSEELKIKQTSDSSHCFIKDIMIQNKENYLIVDFIQFFTAERATEEAKKRGRADYDIEENGDTTFFVYNDYYIANDNPKLRTFRLTDSTQFEFLEAHGDTAIDFGKTEIAMRRVAFSPFIIETELGNVLRLKEIFTP